MNEKVFVLLFVVSLQRKPEYVNKFLQLLFAIFSTFIGTERGRLGEISNLSTTLIQ